MSKLKPKIPSNTSIDDVLASIREAIHAETAIGDEPGPAPAAAPDVPRRKATLAPPLTSRSRDTPVSGSMRELRVSLQPASPSGKTGTITTRSEDFLSLKNKLASLRQNQPHDQPLSPSGGEIAGIMGGDVRLEEALAGMNTAGQLQRDNNPAPPAQPADNSVEPVAYAEPMPMRAAIDDMGAEQYDEQYGMAGEALEPAPEAEMQPVEYLEVVQPIPHAAAEMTPRPVAPEPIENAAQPVPIEPAPAVAEATPLHQAPPTAPSVMSPDMMAAATGAFDRLAEDLFNKSTGGGEALEESAREMIKPALKKWLDENLPALVERLVREEIERVARKGGR